MHWKKTKTIYLIRHGESTFNVPPHDASIKDPLLTPTGQQQAQRLKAKVPIPDLVVSSPLRRALLTAIYGFDTVLRTKEMKVVAIPELQEISKYLCDTGSPLENLEGDFSDLPVDFKLVHPSWDSKEGYWAPTERRSLERARKVRRWLRDRPERVIVVISHGHFLQLLTGEGCFRDIRKGSVYPEWRNAEVRSYHFDPKGGEEATLIETRDSSRRVALLRKERNDDKQKDVGNSSRSVRNPMSQLKHEHIVVS
jgi:broad specificity phosphatase PhoE